jgi:rapamycin-insensitive companion of mTOR
LVAIDVISACLYTSSQALTSMFQETTTGSNLSRKGTLLMAEVLQLANKVLPLSMAAKIQVSTDDMRF